MSTTKWLTTWALSIWTLYADVTPEYIEYKWSFYKKMHTKKVEDIQPRNTITNSVAPDRLNAWPQVCKDWSLTLSS